MAAADRADDARHRVRVAGAVERRARVVEVDAVERGGEAVRVALAPDLAVGDDVEPGVLLGADREQGRVVLRLARATARRPARAPARARAAGSGRRASRGRSASRAAGSCRRESWGIARLLHRDADVARAKRRARRCRPRGSPVSRSIAGAGPRGDVGVSPRAPNALCYGRRTTTRRDRARCGSASPPRLPSGALSPRAAVPPVGEGTGRGDRGRGRAGARAHAQRPRARRPAVRGRQRAAPPLSPRRRHVLVDAGPRPPRRAPPRAPSGSPGIRRDRGLDAIETIEDLVFHTLDVLDALGLERATSSACRWAAGSRPSWQCATPTGWIASS